MTKSLNFGIGAVGSGSPPNPGTAANPASSRRFQHLDLARLSDFEEGKEFVLEVGGCRGLCFQNPITSPGWGKGTEGGKL
jgi:hypothetical protein